MTSKRPHRELLYKKALEHLADHGCMHDTNPTRMDMPTKRIFMQNPNKAWDMYNEEVTFRIKWAAEMDRAVRAYARNALNGGTEADYAQAALLAMFQPATQKAPRRRPRTAARGGR